MFEIVHSTPEEKTRVWAAGTPEWGKSMGEEGYIARETFLQSLPISGRGGMSYWVLSDKNPPTPRPLYSTMESLHRRILVARPNKPLFEAVCHGIASVLTFPEHRGKGYATKLLTGVGEELRTHEGTDFRGFDPEVTGSHGNGKDAPVACSVLFSDVGDFYAGMGWVRFPSKHIVIPFEQSAAPARGVPPARPLALEDVPALCRRDEALLRVRLSQPTASTKTRVVVVLDLEIMRWHLLAEAFATRGDFDDNPQVRGAMWTRNPDGSGPAVWALFRRTYYGDATPEGASRERNVLHIIRLVIDETGAEDVTKEELAGGLEAVLRVAIDEGKKWRTEFVELWNPTERVLGMIRGRGLRGEVVERQKLEILSMNWYGDEGSENVEWLEGQKYAWC